MRTDKILAFFLLLSITQSIRAQVKPIISLSSPDKSTICTIGQGADADLQYQVSFHNKVVLNWSALGLAVNDTSLQKSVRAIAGATRTVKQTFAWPLGEDDHITDHFNEQLLHCQAAGISFNLILRAYDGSIAFRYELPHYRPGAIQAELTTFELASPSILYQYNSESVFIPTNIDTLKRTCDLPATVTNQQGYLSIGEADNINYTKAELKKGPNGNSLAIAFPRDKVVNFNGPYLTPWRTVSVAETAIGLHAFSQLYLKLASKPAPAVPAWIKPGKLIRAQLTTQAGLDCIDFAAKHDFQYIMFDAGWYGAEFRSSSDPTQVIPEIDMPRVIAYGKDKGIGVILYVNYVGLQAKLDTILPLYKQWGVAGLKFGFVDGITQKGLTWLTNAIPKVYNHGFILNIHDNYKPTGLSRTWPSLLTQEGIRGDENSPDAFHTTVLPFTRFLAGPADFTFCYPNTTNDYSKNIKVSMAQQLALTVVNFSPLQSMLWYGKPTEYTNEEEIEFFKYVPTVWNESHYLAGEIGQNISVARRHGGTWFVGNVAGFDSWSGKLTCTFLAKGKRYTATIYEDDGKGSIEKRTVVLKRGDKLPFTIAAKGGQAMIIRETK